MLQKQGNIFEQYDAHGMCFTSNGIIKHNGHLVMGAGIALEFAKRWSFLPAFFGNEVRNQGNHVHCFSSATKLDLEIPLFRHIISFPTKHHWKDASDLNLIQQSAHELVVLADRLQLEKVYLPRPGCSLGRRNWSDVFPILNIVLDNRFTVVSL